MPVLQLGKKMWRVFGRIQCRGLSHAKRKQRKMNPLKLVRSIFVGEMPTCHRLNQNMLVLLIITYSKNDFQDY